MDSQGITLTKAFNENLRLKGEPLGAFGAQIKALDDADRTRYAQLFGEIGIVIDPASILRPAPAIVADAQV